PRLASAAPFLCLIECHLEWPDILKLQMNQRIRTKYYHTGTSKTAAGARALNSPHDDYPHVGAFVPRPAAIITQDCLDGKSSSLEPACQLLHAEGSKRQLECALVNILAAPPHVALFE